MKTFFSFLFCITAVVLISFTPSLAQSDKEDEDLDSLSAKIGKELDKVFNTKVDMVVDSTVFPAHQANFYFNEEENAMIMTLVAPQSFTKAEEHFDRESKKDGYKVLEKKKFTHEGRNFLYQKGMVKKEGKKGIMYLYAIECTAESTIFFTALHMAGDDAKFFPVIERAALSAKLAK